VNDQFQSEQNVAKERANNRRRNVAVVGFRNSENKILMIRTARLPSRWQPIGGGMEPTDASPKQALVREVAEEIGISIEPSDLNPVIEAPYDFGEGTVYFFEARYDEHVDSIRINENEIVEHRWVDMQEAASLPAFPATQRFLEKLASDSYNNSGRSISGT
jgi:8-oxo-dGTP diphosphatase